MKNRGTTTRADGERPADPRMSTGGDRHSTFEEAFAAAERAIDLLESGDLPLEDALRRYEEGLLAILCCRDFLESAERRIEALGRSVGCVTEGEAGPVWKPATSIPQLREALDALDRGGRSRTAEDESGA